jgi:hypothetical protein
MSPADLYEKNKARGAQIVEMKDGRVDVIGEDQGEWRWVFFRTFESCQRFTEEQVRAEEQKRKQEQEELSKYR